MSHAPDLLHARVMLHAPDLSQRRRREAACRCVMSSVSGMMHDEAFQASRGMMRHCRHHEASCQMRASCFKVSWCQLGNVFHVFHVFHVFNVAMTEACFKSLRHSLQVHSSTTTHPFFVYTVVLYEALAPFGYCCIHTDVYICIYIHIYVYIHMCMCINIHVYIHMYIHVYICIQHCGSIHTAHSAI